MKLKHLNNNYRQKDDGFKPFQQFASDLNLLKRKLLVKEQLKNEIKKELKEIKIKEEHYFKKQEKLKNE